MNIKINDDNSTTIPIVFNNLIRMINDSITTDYKIIIVNEEINVHKAMIDIQCPQLLYDYDNGNNLPSYFNFKSISILVNFLYGGYLDDNNDKKKELKIEYKILIEVYKICLEWNMISYCEMIIEKLNEQMKKDRKLILKIIKLSNEMGLDFIQENALYFSNKFNFSDEEHKLVNIPNNLKERISTIIKLTKLPTIKKQQSIINEEKR